MVFPDGIAAETFAHKHLEQEFANRLQRGIGYHQVYFSAPVFHIDSEVRHDDGVRQAGNGCKAGIGFQAIESKVNRGYGVERGGQVRQNKLYHLFDDVQLDGSIGASFNAHGRGSASAAEKNVHHRVDEGRVKRHQSVVIPFFSFKYVQKGGERQGIDIFAEAH